jgi:medium-chain acyl-[acyl-carrier-protein] hydrolase
MTPQQNPNLIWREEYTIRSYEADAQGRATMPLLCRFLQESASNHAEHLGFGISWLTENNFAWFLTRQLVVIDAYPKLGETIQVLTWPKGRDRLLWYRDFKILDSSDAIIGRAVTAWLVIDLDRRRPRRTDTLPPLHPPNDIEFALPRRPGKVAALSEGTPSHPIRVGYQDLDANEHVNSARYVEWIMDAFDVEFHKSHRLGELEVNYLTEALYGDALSSHWEDTDGHTFLHSLVRDGDGLELFRARTHWEPTR